MAPLLLNGGDLGEVAFMILGFMLLGLAFGQSSGVVASNFATETRYTGSALTSDLAWLVGAGFAPLVALLLSVKFGLAASDRKSTRLNSSHYCASRMPSSA